MNNFLEAFKFIGRNGQIPGEPGLPTLVHLTLETLKIAGIGVAIAGVDRDLVDAAKGMGMTGWEILRRVELPLGVPLIFAGIRTAALFVVSTTTIAALTGYSGSLGDIINNEASYHLSGVLGAAICIAALALVVEFALAMVQRLLTPKGLKVSTAEDTVSSLAPVVTEP